MGSITEGIFTKLDSYEPGLSETLNLEDRVGIHPQSLPHCFITGIPRLQNLGVFFEYLVGRARIVKASSEERILRSNGRLATSTQVMELST
jgi:hypothetical protein